MNSKLKALHKASGKTKLHKARRLTPAESKAKMKALGFPMAHKEKIDTVDYQRNIGRAYND